MSLDSRSRRLLPCALLVAALAPSCGRGACPPGSERTAADAPNEHPVRLLALAGPMAAAEMEVSAMAWHGDRLVFVPERLGLDEEDDVILSGAQRVFVLDKRDIIEVLDGRRPGPLTPQAVPVTPSIAEAIEGCDGFEAVAFLGDHAYFAVETRTNADASNPTLLVHGKISKERRAVTLDLAQQRPLRRPTGDDNLSHEALFIWRDRVYAIYELNAADRITRPRAAVFSLDLQAVGDVAFPHIDYRITDVTAVDAAGHLWAINYRYPGSSRASVAPERESLGGRYGRGATHQRFEQVERLVELAVDDAGLRLTDRAPIQLRLEDDRARNWEGIVRLDDRGFLLVTDQFPQTWLGFVALDERQP
ncbi:MAG: hypothetical protein CSA66_05800 [Proteobacteria bacterium]|nr:MAG: hypothetical protein CSA66_05800 [Pseudomonadota bacterium]